MRDKYDIICDILEAILREDRIISKMRIAQKAKMKMQDFGKYHDMLLEQGAIFTTGSAGYYQISWKGRKILKRIKNLKSLLK